MSKVGGGCTLRIPKVISFKVQLFTSIKRGAHEINILTKFLLRLDPLAAMVAPVKSPIVKCFLPSLAAQSNKIQILKGSVLLSKEP